MKTNIGIELTEDQRIDLGQKYYKKKKPITRADLNIIVKDYINKILEAESYTLTEKQDSPFLAKEWSSLSQFRDHLRQQDFTILSFDGFQLIARGPDKQVHTYSLALGKVYKD
tara:strand:- start:410 stop:748 length:339 start_codon:yes stop_codon:yes gene_type:complete